MNFKRRKPRRNRINSLALNAKRVSHWCYGSAIAKECALRKEFRDEIKYISTVL